MGQNAPPPEAPALASDAPPGVEPEGPFLEAVKEALGALNKAIRFRRMYPTTHEFYRRVIVELRERLEGALSLEAPVELEVGAQSFLLGTTTVFTDERGQQNLPFRFYKDGIQSITFQVGIEEGELGRLLDALQLDMESKGASQDDLAINLWNAGLEHISFFAVDELDPEASQEKREGEGEKSLELRALGTRVEELLERLGEAVLPASASEVAHGRGFLRQLSVGEKEVFEVERGEGLATIEEHVVGEDSDRSKELTAEEQAVELAEMRDVSDLPRRTIGMLRWLIERDEVTDTRSGLPSLVWDLLAGYIAEGRLDILNRAIAELRIGQLRARGEARNFCQAIVDGIAAPERIDAILKLMNARKANEKDLGELLSVMPDQGLSALAPLFSKIRSDEGRRLVLAALVDRAAATPDMLKPIVGGNDPQAALEAIRALRLLESPWALDIVLVGLASAHAEVRAEAIRSIPQNDLERHDERLAVALEDPSPNVRGLAARRLAVAGTREAVKALRGRLAVPSPSVEERVGLLRALAIADADAIEVLLAEAGPPTLCGAR